MLIASFTVKSQTNFWTIYNSSNSDLPSDTVTCGVVDNNGNKWFGLSKTGDNHNIAMFNDSTWIIHDPLTKINVLTVDTSNNNIWCGGLTGVAMYDNISWITYDEFSDYIPENKVYSILINGNDKWFGTLTQ